MRDREVSVGWVGDPQTLRIPTKMLQVSEPLKILRAHSSNPDRLIELPDNFDLAVLSTIADIVCARRPLTHTVLRFVRGGGTLHALQQHMEMLDLQRTYNYVLTHALRATEFLLGLKMLESNEAFLSIVVCATLVTRFRVVRRQSDRAYVAYFVDGRLGTRPCHYVLWCPYCRMYTVVSRDDPRPKVYPFVDVVAVLLFAGKDRELRWQQYTWKATRPDEYNRVAHDLWMAAMSSEVRDRLDSCCLTRGSPACHTDCGYGGGYGTSASAASTARGIPRAWHPTTTEHR